MEVRINGARIHYRRSGAGFPVIFLHAGVADSRMWQPQATGLGQHFDVIRPDRRGFGHSELPAGKWSPTADVLGLMDALGLRHAPHIVGCSIGGALAIDFALEHPDRVAKLVLVGAGVHGTRPQHKYDHLFAEIEAADKAGDMKAVNEAEMHVWLDGPDRPRGYVAEPLRSLFLDMNGRALASPFDKSPAMQVKPPAAKRLHEIKAPTLVMVGDKDLQPIRDTADVLMSSIPGARKAVINDAAHLPNLEHPHEFNRLVLDFLNG